MGGRQGARHAGKRTRAARTPAQGRKAARYIRSHENRGSLGRLRRPNTISMREQIRSKKGGKLMTTIRHATRAGLAALALALATSVAMADTVVLTAYSGIFQENYVKAVVEPFMK